MSNNAPTLEAGQRPWLPTADSVPGLELDRYDFPLAGFFAQTGTEFFYVCAFGEQLDTNIWFYARVSQAERAALETAAGAAQNQVIMATLKGRDVTVAGAHDWLLETWCTLDVGLEPPATIAKRFRQRQASQAKSQQAAAEHLDDVVVDDMVLV